MCSVYLIQTTFLAGNKKNLYFSSTTFTQIQTQAVHLSLMYE